MKRAYETPRLIEHGTVETMTQVLGPDSIRDTLIFNGDTLGTSDDSQDVILGTSAIQGP